MYRVAVSVAELEYITIDVFCNDEGLIMGLPIRAVRLTDGSPLAGDLVVVGSDAEGNSVSLDAEDIYHVLQYIKVSDAPIYDDYEF